MHKLFTFLFLNFLSLSALAQGEINGDEELKSALSQNFYEPNYFSLLFGLILVIGLIYFTGIIYQKLIKVKLDDSNDETNKITIISTTSLGQGKNLHIIKVNNTYSLIGATSNNINFLRDFPKEDMENFPKENNQSN